MNEHLTIEDLKSFIHQKYSVVSSNEYNFRSVNSRQISKTKVSLNEYLNKIHKSNQLFFY